MGNNFKYLDELVHSGVKKIILDSDIVLGEGEESEYSDGIKLDFDDLIIDGNNYSIDACEKTRIFECSGKNVSIKNITLKNGYSKEHGGAILNTSDLSIFNSKFMKNRTKHDGAAIYNCKGNLAIKKVTFDNNVASYYNRNSTGKGGAIDNSKGILNIEESLFTENYSSYGGAIRNGGELTIDHSTFDKNTAGMYGGVVYNESCAILNIIASTFTQNKADFNGGVLYNDGKSALNIAESTFVKNSVFWDGGAIYNRDGNLTIGESRFLANEAGNGGALCDECGEVTIFKSALNGNYSKGGDGGAIHLEDCGSVNIEESSLKENKSGKDGGAIFNMDSNLSIKNSILDENMAIANGGVIYNLRSSLSIHGSTVTKNVAKEGGGGAIYNRKAEFAITDSIFNENVAKFNEKATDWNGVVVHISDEFTKRVWIYDLIKF